jgi:Cdc6-like AAA superfamily ATPase
MSWFSWFLPSRKRTAPRVRGAAHEEEIYVPAPVGVTAPERTAAAVDAPPLPRFRTTAGDQIDPRTADRFASLRSKLSNAYTPAQPVTDRRMFAGRTKVMTTLIRSIEDQRLHAVIYGERGIGKTSLMHMVAMAAQEARYLVVYLTCGARSEFDETFRAIAAAIPLMYHKAYGPTSPEGERGDTLASVLSPEPITVRGASEALNKIEGTRVLVILDEYDRSISEDFRRSVGELLKSLSDQSVRVQFMIAGVAANMTELVANVPSIQRNIIAMQLPKMTAAEIRGIIRNGEAITDLEFDDGAVHGVIARCIGFPYLASLISHRSALAAMDQSRSRVTAADVAAATAEVLEEFRGRISRRTHLQIEDQVRLGKLAVLGALAGAAHSTGGWFTTDEISGLHADAVVISEAPAYAESLAERHILIEDREDEFGRAFRFLEPSSPVYIWLMAARAETSDHWRPEVMAATA